MAKVLIKNTREQDLTLNVGDESLKVPAGVNGPEGMAPGTAFGDDKFIEEAKKHPVVKAWFAQGWLVVDRKAAE